MDELDSILCLYQTTPQTSIGETPFKLTYGAKVVIPFEIGLVFDRVKYNKKANNERL